MLTQNYSAIITKGLCAPACCALLTANFGLVCGCHISVIEPPTGGGGGFIPVQPGYLIPVDRTWTQSTRIVVINVKLGEHTWRKHYVVDEPKAKYLVTAINIYNTIADKVRISVAKVKQTTKRVFATFLDK